MEDSFRVRVEKAFGSLPIHSSSSLWSLTEDEINNKPSNQTRRPKPESEPKPKPEPKPYSSPSPSSSGFKVELENDLEDLDAADAGPSKPPDYDDEQWQIRSGIGLDCTLDFEVQIVFLFIFSLL